METPMLTNKLLDKVKTEDINKTAESGYESPSSAIKVTISKSLKA